MPTLTVAAVDSKNRSRADFRCDGTDDDVVVNAAISALPVGGGKISLLEGNYYVTDRIKLSSNMLLEGQGSATIIQLPAGHGVQISGLIWVDGVAAKQSNVTIQNLAVDGIGLSLSTIGIYIQRCDHARVNNVIVRNCDGGSSYGLLTSADNVGLTVTSSYFHDCSNNVIEIKQAPGACFVGNQFENGKCELYCRDSPRSSISMFGNYFTNADISMTPDTGYIESLVFSDNVMTGGKFLIRACKSVLISNNLIDASAVADFSAQLMDIQDTVTDYRITGNVIKAGYNSGTGFGYGTILANGVRGLISNNTIFHEHESNYGIRVNDSDASRLIIDNNTFIAESGTTNSKGIRLNEGDGVTIRDNSFKDTHTAVYVEAAATGTVIVGGEYDTVTVPINNADTTAVIRDVDENGIETVTDGFGGTVVRGSVSEEITLSTVALTTDSAANLLPADAVIESVTARITTTIANATNWAVGDPTTAARFSAANVTLTANETSVGLDHVDQSGAAGPKQTSAAKVRITCTGSQPDAGVVRVTVQYRQHTAAVA